MPTLQGSVAGGRDSANDAQTTVSHTLVSASNRIVFCMTGSHMDATVSGTPTYGGNNMTKAIDFEDAHNLEIWYILEANLPADGANDCVVNWSASTTYKGVHVFCFDDLTQTTPEDTDFDTNGRTVSFTVTANALMIATFYSDDFAGNHTWAGHTELFDVAMARSASGDQWSGAYEVAPGAGADGLTESGGLGSNPEIIGASFAEGVLFVPRVIGII